MRRLAHLTAVALATSALTIVGPSAHADGGSTSSSPGVLYDGCTDHAYSYALDLPVEAVDWSVELESIAPDGSMSASDFLYDGADPVGGESSFLHCGYEMAGTYDIEGVVNWYDAAYVEHTFPLDTSSYTMRRPRSRTRLTASTTRPRCRSVVTMRVRALDERPRGYFGTSYATVLIQKKVAGRPWRTVRGTRTVANQYGVARIRGRYGRPCRPVRLRAKTVAEAGGHTASFSRPVLLRRR